MIRTPINRDIGKLKNNVFKGLSWRELTYCAVAVIVGCGVFFVIYPFGGTTVAAWITMISVMPIGASGFFNINGIYLLGIVREIILQPKPWLFDTEYKDVQREEKNSKKRRWRNKCNCLITKKRKTQR